MPMRMSFAAILTVTTLALLMPAAAMAQSAIAGVVKDTSGAVMPGVTVEAASPALFERSRTGDHGRRGSLSDDRPSTWRVCRRLTPIRFRVQL